MLLVLNFRGKSILRLEDETREHANDVKNTVIFNAFVLCQVSRRILGKSKLLFQSLCYQIMKFPYPIKITDIQRVQCSKA